MDRDLVSIIVPIYNRAENLARAVTSLLRQSYRDLEIILVDDHSSDNSFAIAQLFARKDARVKLLRDRQNVGVSAARNRGLDAAGGQWLVFVDADDWTDPGYVENFIQMAADSQSDLVIAGHHGDHSLMRMELPFSNKAMTGREVIEDILSEVGPIGGYLWNKMFKHKIVEQQQIRFHEEVSFLEDELFTIEYATHIDSAFYDSKAFYHYEIQNDSLSSDALSKMMPAMKQRDQILRKENIDPDDYRKDPLSLGHKNWERFKENWKNSGQQG